MANTRYGSLVVEQRELRNHWMQEKTELDGKMFQLQALQTQVQGTMRKKEKEFEKLQGHLQKQVKDSLRGQKIGVVMSKPAPKNSSQVKSAPGAYLLRDAELAAVNGTVAELTAENTTLRAAIDKLGENTASLQAQFTSSIAHLTTKYQTEQETLLQKIKELHDLQEQQQQQQQRTVGGSPSIKRSLVDVVERDVTASVSVSVSVPMTEEAAPMSPMIVRTMNETEASCILAASVKKRRMSLGNADAEDSSCLDLGGMYNVGTTTTPCAKPVGWVTDRVATGLKQLSMTMNESLLEASSVPQSAMKRTMNEDIHRLKKMNDEIDRLRAELSCAMNQIHEQDKLIHQALIGQLPGLILEQPVYFDDELSNDMVMSDQSNDISNQPALSVPLSPDFKDDSLEDKFQMPPASPATKALLDSFGWNVPQRMDPQSAVKVRISA